jgi:hypothetical protein
VKTVVRKSLSSTMLTFRRPRTDHRNRRGARRGRRRARHHLPAPPAHPSRAGAANLEAKVEQVVVLGALRLTGKPVTEAGLRCHILADPDGNEFCILQPPSTGNVSDQTSEPASFRAHFAA